jgi:hypothetical protein
MKYSASVMVWGCFSGNRGRRGLYFLPKNATMNDKRYLKVVQHHLLPFMKVHKSTWFLQDGAPCHTFKLMEGRLKEMKKEFQMMDWPGNSPDLNPIENCWSLMKYKLKSKPAVTSLPKMIQVIKMIWVKDMPLEYFRKLADSMPRRIEEVLAINGHMSK